jgi:hypothetical protein
MPPKDSSSNFLQLPESQISCLYLKNTKNSRTTKIEGLPTGFEGQDLQEKRHTNLMCDSQHKSRKETPLKPSHKIHQKGFENHRKSETGGAIRTLEESRRTFYTYHERFIQGLTCLLNIHPSLKISSRISQASPMENLKGK